MDLSTIISLGCIDYDRTFFWISALLFPSDAIVLMGRTSGSQHCYIISRGFIDDDGTYCGISAILIPLVVVMMMELTMESRQY